MAHHKNKEYTRIAKKYLNDDNLAAYNYTVGIECIHNDDGSFTNETIRNLSDCIVHITSLTKKELPILLHYHITGKMCPRYYAKDPVNWAYLYNQISLESQRLA